MTKPPEYIPEPITEAQTIEQRLTEACATITAHWDQMLPTGPTSSVGAGAAVSRTSTGRDEDNGDHNRDVGAVDVVVSLRHDVTVTLNSWCQVVIEAFNVTTVVPDGLDAKAMAAFLARWARHLSGHDAGRDCADEVHAAARSVRGVAVPHRRDWVGLGECPLEGDDGQVCGGQVRAYPEHLDEDGDAWASCRSCGTKAVASWWEAQMFPDGTSRLVTADGVVTLLHRTYGRVVTPSAVRKWVQRGLLERSGTDDRGRALYSPEAVVWAMERQRRRDTLSA